MNIIRIGSRFLQRSSPVTLAVTGLAVAFALPPVRKGLRAVAVMATRGVIAVTDEVRSWHEDIMEEAQERIDYSSDLMNDKLDNLKKSFKTSKRKIALAAATGALAVSDQAKAIHGEINDIVEEAAATRRKKGHTTNTKHEHEIHDNQNASEDHDNKDL